MDPITTNQTYNIGPSGHYPTMQAALDDLGYIPVANDVTITLRWQAGHVPTTGIRLIGGDYSHFVISHATASSGTDANGIPLPQITLNSSWPSNTPVMYGERAALPVWNVLLNMNGRGARGIEAVEGSTVSVAPGKGILRATATVDTAGLYMASGTIGVAREAIFAYCGRGLWITRASALDAEKTNCDRCLSIGVYASRASNVAFADGKARYITTGTGGSGCGVVANRAFIAANTDSGLCDVSNCSRGFVSEYGGTVDASESAGKNCLIRGVSAESGHVVCETTDCSGSAVGFYVSRGGTIARYAGAGSNSQARNSVTANGVIYSNV